MAYAQWVFLFRSQRLALVLALIAAHGCGDTSSQPAVSADAGGLDVPVIREAEPPLPDVVRPHDARPDARPDATPIEAGTAPTRVYLNVVSHNEEQPNKGCIPVLTDRAKYLENRAMVLELAKLVVEKNVVWDMQSDWEFLEAVRKWDDSSVTATSTEGKNLIRYLAERSPKNIVVDAHAHETKYNYADVVALLEGLGAPRNTVIGGFIYYPSESESWSRLRNPLKGDKSPSATWTGRLLWGAGTFQHKGPDSFASGIWRPKAATAFHVDDPAGNLINIGGYRRTAEGATELVTALTQGALEAGKMYTASIFFDQCELTSTDLVRLTSFINSIAPNVSRGEVVWASLEGMAAVWRDEYAQSPVIYHPPGTDPVPY